MSILEKFSYCEINKYIEVVAFKTEYSTAEFNVLEQIVIVKTKSLIFYQALAFCNRLCLRILGDKTNQVESSPSFKLPHRCKAKRFFGVKGFK